MPKEEDNTNIPIHSQKNELEASDRTGQLLEEFKELQHNHTIKGEADLVGVISSNNSGSGNLPQSVEHKKEKDMELIHFMLEMDRAFEENLNRLNEQLDQINHSIEELNIQMLQNRKSWDASLLFINEIDDVLDDFKQTGSLDKNAIQKIYAKNGKEIPDGIEEGSLLILIQKDIMEERQFVDRLDQQYLRQEQKMSELNEIKEKTQEAIDDFEAADSFERRLEVMDNYDLKTLHKAAKEVVKMDVSFEDNLQNSVTNPDIQNQIMDKEAMLNFTKSFSPG